MAGYLILNYSVDNVEQYHQYVQHALPILEKHEAKLLIASYAPDADGIVFPAMRTATLEGSAPDVIVVVEFPSVEAANKFYDDPDYAAIMHLRTDSTSNAYAVVADEFRIPEAS